MTIDDRFKSYRKLVNDFLDSHIASGKTFPEILYKSMRYSLFAGGKRIRPILTFLIGDIIGIDRDIVVPIAAAIESIHTYSLIHDDLPSMDDDDLRRGVPTNHIKFGEDVAILSGDALLTESFKLLTYIPAEKTTASQWRQLLLEFTISAGAMGIIGGQISDIKSDLYPPTLKTLEYIHKHKTASMIRLSINAPVVFSDLPILEKNMIDNFGDTLGLLFQIVDDILDVEGDTETLGKPALSDEKNNKLTYPSLLGLKEAKAVAAGYYKNILSQVEELPDKYKILNDVTEYVYTRIK